MNTNKTSTGTYTIAILASTGLLLACIPDGGDINAAVRAVEAETGALFDEDDINVESGLTLTDSADCGDIRYTGLTMGVPTDSNGVTYTYAVRLPEDDTLNEYAFDITLAGALRVKACSEADARAVLAEVMDCADTNFGAWPNGDPIVGETSLRGVPQLYEVNGKEPDAATADPLELLRACVAAKNAFWDAFALLEKRLAPGGFSKHANDRVIELIDDMCVSAGCPPMEITSEHLAMVIRRAGV